MSGATIILNDEELHLRFTMGDLAKVKRMLGKPFMAWMAEDSNFANSEGLIKVLGVGLASAGNPKPKEYFENEVDAGELNNIVAALMCAVGGEKGKRRVAAVYAQQEAEVVKMERDSAKVLSGNDSAGEDDYVDVAPDETPPLA